MKNTSSLYEQRIAQLTKEAVSHREKFRAEAVEVYAIHTLKERYTLATLETASVHARDIFMAWRTYLLPLHETIDISRSKSAFRRHIAKHLFLSDDAAQEKAIALVDERKMQALEEVLVKLYTYRRSKKACSRARYFLKQPNETIMQLERHFMEYSAYKQVAAGQRIVIIDPYELLFLRLCRRIALWRERKRVIANETKRLIDLHVRLDELAMAHDGLVKTATERKWDIATAISLRAQYEKQVASLSQSEMKNALKRLSVYDEITREFRDKHTELHASAHSGLKGLRSIANDIDALLLHLFDLSNAEKNQFVTLAKEYRELTRERAAITHLQENRFSF